jgi:hypothetical protein
MESKHQRDRNTLGMTLTSFTKLRTYLFVSRVVSRYGQSHTLRANDPTQKFRCLFDELENPFRGGFEQRTFAEVN